MRISFLHGSTELKTGSSASLMLGLLILALGTACNKVSFAPVDATNPGNVVQDSPDPGPIATPTPAPPPMGLKAAALVYAIDAGQPLSIPKDDIMNAVTAPFGDVTQITGLGTPTLGGQLADNGDHYTFFSSTVGNSQFSYFVSDWNGAQASSVIVVKVMNAGKATGFFYACSNSQLYTLSSDSGSLLQTVSTTYQGSSLSLNDLAIDPDGNLYGKDKANSGIYKLDANTGAATQIVATVPNSSGELAGLTFLPSGELATVQSDGSILAFNLTTLKTRVMLTSSYKMLGGDLKALPDGYIYWTVSNGSSSKCKFSTSGTQALVRVDPATATMTEIGCLDQPSIYGLGFARGTIYGFTGAGDVLQVDTTTAKTTVLSSPGYQFWGAASNPALW